MRKLRILKLFIILSLPCQIALAIPPLPHEITGIEGFGAVTQGGAGGDVYHVTTLANSGGGSLREGVINRSGPRTIVFDVGGTIQLRRDIAIKMPFLTIAGETAPSPGITVTKTTIHDGEFIVGGTHDIIIRHLRFHGLYRAGGPTSNNAATIVIDGDTRPDRVAKNIVLDHITARNATDGGPDIWGAVEDVTVSWCFFFYNWHPTTVSHYPGPYFTRQRISMHHNVYAKNGERNPQLRADVRAFDYVNNILYDWSYWDNWGYGIRVKNNWTPGEPQVNANFINNAFLPTKRNSWALVYGKKPGADRKDGASFTTAPPQGTVLSNTDLGNLYVTGNLLPAENKDQYSTVSSSLHIPPSAQVTTFNANELGTKVLPHVGVMHRDSEEQTILDEIAAAMGRAAFLPDPATTIFVDHELTVDCAGQTYSIGNRDCSQLPGQGHKAVNTLQNAADIVRPGQTVLIREGTYQDVPENCGSSGYCRLVDLKQSGRPGEGQRITFQNYPGEKVVLRGLGYEDNDLDGDGLADGPASSSAREDLFIVEADYIRIVGLEFTNSSRNGLDIRGSFNRVEHSSSHDNWLIGIRVGFETTENKIVEGNVLRFLETYRNRHGNGITLGRSGRGSRDTYLNYARDNIVENSLSYHNGYQPDGSKVLPISGDSVGGGNSDAMGTFKTCHDSATPEVPNWCPGNVFRGNIGFGNADDGLDVSFADSLVENNIMFQNGPEGNRGFKVLRYVNGNTYRGNIAYNNGRGFELRVVEGGAFTVYHNLAVRHTDGNTLHSGRGVFVNNLDIDVYEGDPQIGSASPAIHTNFLAGMSIEEKLAFLRNQFRAAFAPVEGSPLIDAGHWTKGVHCLRADDDPKDPYPATDPSCRHWKGTAPDLGVYEYGLINPSVPELPAPNPTPALPANPGIDPPSLPPKEGFLPFINDARSSLQKGAIEVKFGLQSPGHVLIEVRAVNGRLVKTLVNESIPAGRHAKTWDLRNTVGERVVDGIYLLLMKTHGKVDKKKVVVL